MHPSPSGPGLLGATDLADPAAEAVAAPSHRAFVRTATSGDLPATAALQIAELPIGLFPRLGARFVARWHRTFLDSPHAVALVAIQHRPDRMETVVGFLLGSTDREEFRRELLTRHRRALLARGVLALAGRPRVLGWFLRTRLGPYLRRLHRPRADAPVEADPAGADTPVADLTAIAVDQGARRGGTGRRLTEIYLARCAAVGTGSVELVTSTNAPAAAAFYAGTGWTAIGQDTTRDGVQVKRFARRTDQRQEPGLDRACR